MLEQKATHHRIVSIAVEDIPGFGLLARRYEESVYERFHCAMGILDKWSRKIIKVLKKFDGVHPGAVTGMFLVFYDVPHSPTRTFSMNHKSIKTNSLMVPCARKQRILWRNFATNPSTTSTIDLMYVHLLYPNLTLEVLVEDIVQIMKICISLTSHCNGDSL